MKLLQSTVLILLLSIIAFSCEDENADDPIIDNPETTGYFFIDGEKHELSKAALVYFDGTEKWHQLILYNGMTFSATNSEYLAGTGNLVYLDILAGKAKFDIVGTYTNNTGTFDGTDDDVANMADLNIYNGFAAIAHDYNWSDESPEGNNVADAMDNEDYQNFSMTISKSGDIYTVDISFTGDGKDIEIFYEGTIEMYED